MDLTNMTDEELDNHRREVLIEIEKRAAAAAAPEKLRSEVCNAVAAGVDEASIRAAVEDGLTSQGEADAV